MSNCVTRKQVVRCEKNLSANINCNFGCSFLVSLCVLISCVIGHCTINITEISYVFMFSEFDSNIVLFLSQFSLSGPPPSYQSLFGEIKDARHGSSSVLDFLKKLILILAGTSKFENDYCYFTFCRIPMSKFLEHSRSWPQTCSLSPMCLHCVVLGDSRFITPIF